MRQKLASGTPTRYHSRMRSPAKQDYFAELRQVLDRWDPIGVAGAVAGEYDSYVGPIMTLIDEGVDADRLTKHLLSIETSRMGLLPHPDRAALIASQLLARSRPIAGTPVETLAPLIGHMAWAASAGFGSFFTLEFGEPHIEVREPIESTSDSEKVRRSMRRRRAILIGDWHLWIEHAAWRVTTMSGTIEHEIGRWPDWQEHMKDLSGQILENVEGRGCAGLLLAFDLGSTIELWPDDGVDGNLWSLHTWKQSIVSCRPDGVLTQAPG